MGIRRYDLFLSHAWRFHDDWTKLSGMLDATAGLNWRNFSLPWHDPAMDPNTETGGRFIRDVLEVQIIPAVAMVLLDGVYAVKSARRWVELEVEMARNHGKTVIGMPPIGGIAVSAEAAALCDRCIGWNVSELLDAVDMSVESS